MSGSSLGIDLRYIGMDGFADEIIAAATALVIRKETVAELVKAHDRLAAFTVPALTGVGLLPWTP